MSELVKQENNFLTVVQQALSNPNMDMSVLKEMLAMQKEVMAQQAVIEFNEDYSIMSAEIPVIKRSKKAYSASYAPMEDIDLVIRPILSKFGFSVSFRNKQDGLDMVEVTCELRHKKGHMIENTITLPTEAATKGMNKQQAIGSAITYAKRYAICGILNITTADDDCNNGFAVDAKMEAAKKPLSDARLIKAIEQVSNGTITIESITDVYDLTPQQLIKIGREVKA